ncbi:MAG: hypothetical protein U0903_11600 [Planctomycetales bacterium]
MSSHPSVPAQPLSRQVFFTSRFVFVGALVVTILGSSLRAAGPEMLDLAGAVVYAPKNMSPREKTAVRMLVEEVEKRTMIRWKTATTLPSFGNHPVIAVGDEGHFREAPSLTSLTTGLAAVQKPEGYRVCAVADRKVVAVIGNDERGVLFGVGRLLRELRMARGTVQISAQFAEASAPETPLRGHQLGYRPKTNSYDAWDIAQWEQYYRDLAVFGTNAIELIPPRSDDDDDSPLFPKQKLDMMVEMSRVADDYGLDVWIWYPAMDKDYRDPATVDFALKEWEEVYKRLPRIDVIFVPGGDPGHTHPVPMMALLEKQTALLHKYHPKAEMWMSPQSFDKAWDDEYYKIMQSKPKWLSGVVFGPQVRLSLPELRKKIPAEYPVRGYPDITHSINCQHPVPEWDTAYALTEAREVINPRPLSQAQIYRYYQQYTIGFLTYSEGCNDDVNKFVWSGLGWNSKTPVSEILRQYSRYFIGDQFTEGFAQGLLSLEQNWVGPLLTNSGVDTTLQQFQKMERQAGPKDLMNWRFQHALYRAYYDAWLRDRLISETAQRSTAADLLRRAKPLGSQLAMNQAEAVLDQAKLQMVSPDRRNRVNELAEALFQSPVHMQLNTEFHKGQPGRGTSHNTIDMPLTDRLWLKGEFAAIRKLERESERLAAIEALIHRTDPGPGSFYDDLGDPSRQPHLVKNSVPFEANPDYRQSVFTSFDFREDWPHEWWNNVLSMNDAPLKMHYSGLDKGAKYKVRVTYAFESTRKVKIKLDAEGQVVHELLQKPAQMTPLEFDVPASATEDGELTLEWTREKGLGGNGRGCQISEVWLLRQD